MGEYRCVRCLTDVDFFPWPDELLCPECGATYPVVDGAMGSGLREIEGACSDVDSMIGPFLLEHAPINTLFLFWK